MPRIIEIVESNKRLHLEYGSLVVRDSEGVLLDRIDLDEILGIICYPHGSMLSAALMAELAQRAIPLVVSDQKFQPTGILLPVVGNYEQSARIEAQIGATVPQKKQIWTSVVKTKLRMQAMALELVGSNPSRILKLAERVKSGDSENLEAQGARVYWPALFGSDFRRNRDLVGINALLNYGYAILRASVARAATSAGLNPSIGIFHRNAYNGLRLVDDLMEPYRPLVDLRVHVLVQSGFLEVSPIAKRALVDVLLTDVPHIRGNTPISVATQYTAISFIQALKREVRDVEYPNPSTNPLYIDFHTLADWAKL